MRDHSYIALSERSNKYSEIIKNYCFESSLANNNLSFDYKLKIGVSQNRNAPFLMKQMGIIDRFLLAPHPQHPEHILPFLEREFTMTK